MRSWVVVAIHDTKIQFPCKALWPLVSFVNYLLTTSSLQWSLCANSVAPSTLSPPGGKDMMSTQGRHHQELPCPPWSLSWQDWQRGIDQSSLQKAAHLHVGSIEIPERGQGSRQPFCAVTNPQGLQMARGDSSLLTEALERIKDRCLWTPPPRWASVWKWVCPTELCCRQGLT